MRILLVALLVVGCKHASDRTHVDPDFDKFETKWVAEGELLIENAKKEHKPVTDADRKGLEQYHGVFIDKTGVIIDRKRVATLAELKTKRDQLRAAVDANRTFVLTVNNTPMVVLDIADQPASVAFDVLELFVGKPTLFSVPNTGEDPRATDTKLSDQTFKDIPHATGGKPTLSVYLTQGRIWVGLSVVNEFQEIVDKGADRDLEKLTTTLREHKASDFFTDRLDIEIAADAGTAGAVIEALNAAADAGFPDIALLSPDRLAAKPSL